MRRTTVFGASGSLSRAGFGTRCVLTGRAVISRPSTSSDRAVISSHQGGALCAGSSPRRNSATWTISCTRTSETWRGPPRVRPLPRNTSGARLIRGESSHEPPRWRVRPTQWPKAVSPTTIGSGGMDPAKCSRLSRANSAAANSPAWPHSSAAALAYPSCAAGVTRNCETHSGVSGASPGFHRAVALAPVIRCRNSCSSSPVSALSRASSVP